MDKSPRFSCSMYLSITTQNLAIIAWKAHLSLQFKSVIRTFKVFLFNNICKLDKTFAYTSWRQRKTASISSIVRILVLSYKSLSGYNCFQQQQLIVELILFLLVGLLNKLTINYNMYHVIQERHPTISGTSDHWNTYISALFLSLSLYANRSFFLVQWGLCPQKITSYQFNPFTPSSHFSLIFQTVNIMNSFHL